MYDTFKKLQIFLPRMLRTMLRQKLQQRPNSNNQISSHEVVDLFQVH